jgi:hypothetical protein
MNLPEFQGSTIGSKQSGLPTTLSGTGPRFGNSPTFRKQTQNIALTGGTNTDTTTHKFPEEARFPWPVRLPYCDAVPD